MNRFIIRPASENDLEAITTIEDICYDFPWTWGIFHDCLKVRYPFFVAEIEGTVVGYIIFTIAVQECHILNLAIEPKAQKQGVASRLIAHAIQKAKRAAVNSIFLEVRLSNDAARKLYKKFGFEDAGLRKHYYRTEMGYEDAIILRLRLNKTVDE